MNSDKCTETISIKVTPALKALYDDLSPEQKKHAKKGMVEFVEKTIHDSRFKRGMYSGEE